MDLSKLPNDRKLYLCKRYFYGGFAMLPFLWLVNAVWFAKTAFCAPPFEEQKQIKKYVLSSAAGAIISLTIYIAWIITFQTYRVSWDNFGDAISFNYPVGRA